MTRYILSTAADALSIALWGLSRPGDLRPDGRPQRMFMSVAGLDGNTYLAVRTGFEVYVHADAELNGIADILQPWIDQGYLPSDTNTQLAALVEGLRGQRLVVYDAFPQLFKDMSKTHAEMIAAGLLAEPATL